MKALLEDVGPFLERPADASLITRENLLALLERKNKDFYQAMRSTLPTTRP